VSADSRRALVGVAVLVLALLVAGGLWVWSANRPAHLIIRPTPRTAHVRIGEREADGVLDVHVPAGEITIEVRAAEHLPHTTTVHLGPGDQLTLEPVLRPLGGPR